MVCVAYIFNLTRGPHTLLHGITEFWCLSPEAAKRQILHTISFLFNLHTMKQDQKTYWDKAAGQKEFTTPFEMAVFEEAVSRDARILDMGCGYGRIMHELSCAGFSYVTGVDFSNEMIEKGRRLYPDLRFQCADLPLGFNENSYDAVTLVAVLTCMASSGDQVRMISEIRRLLKPGGVLYINDFLLNTDQRNLERYEKGELKFGQWGVFELEEGALLRHHSESYLRQLLTGFDVFHFEKLTYVTMNKNRSNGVCLMARFMG